MFYTYVLRSKRDGKLYTGSTHDLRKRFSEHNDEKVVSTKGRGPFELIYYEACAHQEDALARERYLKSGMGKRYVKARLKRFLSLTGQATMELTVALILIMLLIVGSVRIFVWLNERMVYRQVDYEANRVTAGSVSTSIANASNVEQTNGMQVDESAYPELDIFS